MSVCGILPKNRRLLSVIGMFGLSNLIVPVMVGCGPSGVTRFPVEGEVRYQGEIAEAGTIAFYPDGVSGPVVGGNIVDGRYSIDAKGGPVAGMHRVQIEVMKKTGRKVPNMGGDLMDEYDNILPEKYSTPYSEVKVKITEGSNVHNIDLE